MALVEYSSSDDADGNNGTEADNGPPPAKRRKGAGAQAEAAAASELPPLPSAFHDLYASTVRQSVTDDPSLHHGRKRQTPHVVGNWPSHLYVEWHPDKAQHEVLTKLIKQVKGRLDEDAELHDFLSSELGAPLPLHISLSRPLSLTTAAKDEFLDKVVSSISNSTIGVFSVYPTSLAWYRSPDSNRTFLVMRVASTPDAARGHADPGSTTNPEMESLLTQCNAVAERFGQPPLYQTEQKQLVGGAFHVSIGWSFEPPDDVKTIRSLDVFDQGQFLDMRSWKIEVAGIKAKIGNVVSHIPLRPGKGNKVSGSLFGM